MRTPYKCDENTLCEHYFKQAGGQLDYYAGYKQSGNGLFTNILKRAIPVVLSEGSKIAAKTIKDIDNGKKLLPSLANNALGAIPGALSNLITKPLKGGERKRKAVDPIGRRIIKKSHREEAY